MVVGLLVDLLEVEVDLLGVEVDLLGVEVGLLKMEVDLLEVEVNLLEVGGLMEVEVEVEMVVRGVLLMKNGGTGHSEVSFGHL